MDKASIGGVFLAIAGIVAGLLHGRRQPGPDSAAHCGADRIRRHHGRGAAAVPAHHRAGRFPQPGHIFSPLPASTTINSSHTWLPSPTRLAATASSPSTPICNPFRIPFLSKPSCSPSMAPSPPSCAKSCASASTRTTENEDRLPAVFESAGGFSPTIGILGAVLGLIQVMQHLDNIQEVGKGIAVAFVATIYGVGIANLFFLPFAGKMRIRLRDEHQRREMMLEGVISILEGMNPRMLEVKLASFLNDPLQKQKESTA